MKQSPREEKMEICTRNCNLTDCINKAGGYKKCGFYEMIELPRKKVESPSELPEKWKNINAMINAASELVNPIKVESPSEEGKETPTIQTLKGHIKVILAELQERTEEYEDNINDPVVNPKNENTHYFRGKADAYRYAAKQIENCLQWHKGELQELAKAWNEGMAAMWNELQKHPYSSAIPNPRNPYAKD